MTLDDRGRCCGRKPIVYKRHQGPGHPAGLFCASCDRAYDPATREQIENWAWFRHTNASEFQRKVRP